MDYYWNAYKSIVYKNCISPNAQHTSVQFWRDRLFAGSVLYFIPFCLIALVPSVYLSIIMDVKAILVADVITVGTILGVAFLPRISVLARKVLFNGALYFISIVLFANLGYNGPGMLYLLAVSVFVVLSMDKKYGYIVFGLNAITCIIFGMLIYSGWINTVLSNQYELDVWIGVSTNLVFLSGIAVFLIPHLFEGLQTSFDEQQILTVKLEESIESIQNSEQRFKALVQDGLDIIAILDKDFNYKYVAHTAEPVLGISSATFMGTSIFDYIHPDDHTRLSSILKQLKPHEQIQVAPFRFRNSNNEWLWLESTITNMFDNAAVKGFVTNSQDITEQIIYQNKLEESIKEKETLLAEIHHRVKNNLAIISSMMELQAMNSDEVKLKESLRLAQRRIQTIASIHELLYSSESLSYINFGENLTQLVQSIEQMYQAGKHITTSIDAQNLPMNINQAIPCALMINEVITNVYKHAFTGEKSGNLAINLREEHGYVYIVIQDDGKGLPEDFKERATSSIGMALIYSLRDQLEGELQFSSENGTRFTFRFKKLDVAVN